MEQQNPIVKWPFGAATVVTLAAAGMIDLEVINTLTILDGATVTATGDRTLNLAADAELEAGARIILKTKSAAEEKLIPGTGVSGDTITGKAGELQTVEYVYDGTGFIQTGTFNTQTEEVNG